jgi:molybdenum cofactor synthesis domain-containing protein
MTHEERAVRVAVLTISDSGSRGEREDASGDVISEIAAREGYRQVFREMVPDEKELIATRLRDWCDGGDVDLVLTTGGTGLGPRDVTPEATVEVIDIAVPGITEAIRVETMKKTPFAMLSRSIAGVRAGCLILNLPGSPKGVRECLEVAVPVLPHGLAMIKGRRGHPTQ